MESTTNLTGSFLHELREGNMEAFELFYERYSPLLFRIAFTMLGDQMEAEDICHDVFIEAIRGLNQYDPSRGSMEAWLSIKTKSRCLDRLRRKNRFRFESMEENQQCLNQTIVSAEERALSNLQRHTLKQAMSKIPKDQQHVVYGMYFGSHTQQELAERMSKPLGTIKSLVRYGLKNLRKQLGQLGWMETTGGVPKNE